MSNDRKQDAFVLYANLHVTSSEHLSTVDLHRREYGGLGVRGRWLDTCRVVPCVLCSRIVGRG